MKYTFSDGSIVTSKLGFQELLKRMHRLDWLRVLTEGYTEGRGKAICDKALKAYNKTDNFTGIIKLNKSEKEFIWCMLDNDMNTDHDIEILKYYIK